MIRHRFKRKFDPSTEITVIIEDSPVVRSKNRTLNNPQSTIHSHRQVIPSVKINMPRKEKLKRRIEGPKVAMINDIDKRIENFGAGPSTIRQSPDEEVQVEIKKPRNRLFEPLGFFRKAGISDTVRVPEQIEVEISKREIDSPQPFLENNTSPSIEVKEPAAGSSELKVKRSQLNPILAPGATQPTRIVESVKQQQPVQYSIERVKQRKPIEFPQETIKQTAVSTGPQIEKILTSIIPKFIVKNLKAPLSKDIKIDSKRPAARAPPIVEPGVLSNTSTDKLEEMRIFPQKATYDPDKMTSSEREKMRKEIQSTKKRKHISSSPSFSFLPPHLLQSIKKKAIEVSGPPTAVNYVEVNAPPTTNIKQLILQPEENTPTVSPKRNIVERLTRPDKNDTDGLPSSSHSTRVPFIAPLVLKARNSRDMIVPFFTNKYVFSNHFPCPGLLIAGKNFCCTEQYYMWRKAKFSRNEAAASAILMSTDPKQMKLIGSSLDKFDSREWKKISWKYMMEANFAKYEQFEALRFQLFRTIGGILVEASATDLWWGVGLDMDSENLCDQSKWKGENVMGRLLMELRDFLVDQKRYREEIRQAKKQLIIDGH